MMDMDNAFLRYHGHSGEGPPETSVPRRVHARIDKVEYPEGLPRLFLDVIDADWFEIELRMPALATGGFGSRWRSAWPSAPLFALEVGAGELPVLPGLPL